mmetsp:Transcript_4266/g.12157  ORF Transcript_4266/g.12157 Transcript_4266/m.12157 type:complete len:225 (-) Transcript_4266:1222-1896(-)
MILISSLPNSCHSSVIVWVSSLKRTQTPFAPSKSASAAPTSTISAGSHIPSTLTSTAAPIKLWPNAGHSLCSVVAARRRSTSARALRRRTDPCSNVAAPSSRLRLRCEISCLALRLRTEPWSIVAALSSRFCRFCATSRRAVRLLSEFCSNVAAELIWRFCATSSRAVRRRCEFWSSVAAASRSSSTKRTLRSSAGMAPSSSDSDMSSKPPSCTASRISWGGCV